MDGYIAGAERISGRRSGATYRTNLPWRVVWHKMEAPEDDPGTVPDEGWELEQSKRYIAGHPWPPHLWALPLHDWVGQTVALTRSAYALQHDAGDPETNHAHAIQIEVMGWSRDGLDDPGLCDWLGDRVLGPILAAGVPVAPLVVAQSGEAGTAGENGRVRFTWAEWARFNGQCGHQNVPGNDHWDPGIADYLRIARAATNQEDWFTMASEADLMTAVRRVLNEGTGKGQRNWAGTNQAILQTVQGNYNRIGAVGAAVGALDEVDVNDLAAAIVAALPDGGDLDQATIEAGVRAVLLEGVAAPPS
ncbi:MAG: hypothetical protein ACRDI2_13480 [Chloroflexota bacterium]